MSKSALSAVKKLIDGVAASANAVGTLVVLGLVIIVNYDATARSLFNKPFLGAVEVVQFSMVLIVFLQLPDVIRVGRLTRSDGLLSLLLRRRPQVGMLLSRAIDVFSLTFMVIVAVAIWPEFLDMWETQDFFGIPGVFTAPWWPVKLVIFLSASLCALHFILHVIQGPKASARQEETAGDGTL
ncbi:MAG: TRAP transporter small permease [Pseudomonadota bacterium]